MSFTTNPQVSWKFIAKLIHYETSIVIIFRSCSLFIIYIFSSFCYLVGFFTLLLSFFILWIILLLRKLLIIYIFTQIIFFLLFIFLLIFFFLLSIIFFLLIFLSYQNALLLQWQIINKLLSYCICFTLKHICIPCAIVINNIVKHKNYHQQNREYKNNFLFTIFISVPLILLYVVCKPI